MEEEPEPSPPILSPCSSGRRSNDTKSPEFEFWMVRNPSFPQPDLLSADELFSGGVLLPLQHLPHLPPPQDPHKSSGSGQTPKPGPNPADLSAAPALTSSKRWTDIFKKTENVNSKEKGIIVKEKKREKKSGGSTGNGVSGAELNINIWPFSRSGSAGNGGTRPKSAATTSRKVSSAPCSRSNSAGESKSRKWPSSPSRVAGVHLGRSSPVWKLRRVAGGGGGGNSFDGKVIKSAEKGVRNDGTDGRRKFSSAVRGGGGVKTRVLSLNVPMCIGYRHHLSCRSDENSAVSIAAAGGGGGQSGEGIAGEGVRGSNFFNIKGLFSKKVY